MEYYFKPRALGDLKKLSKNVQIRVINKLDFYTSSSNPLKFARRLTNLNLGEYRFRIGDHRVIFDIKDGKIIILTLGHRSTIYK